MSNVPESELQQNLDAILTRAKRTRRDFPPWKAVRRAGRDRRLRCGRPRAGTIRGFLAPDSAAAVQRQVASAGGSREAIGGLERETRRQAHENGKIAQELLIVLDVPDPSERFAAGSPPSTVNRAGHSVQCLVAPGTRRKSIRQLIAFMNVSLDGYFTDRNGDFSWAHQQDPEWNQFVEQNASGGGELVFGRVTYEMMASFWPTPHAAQMMPAVAEGMNRSPKVVFSNTLDQASWNNTRLVKGDIAAATRQMKQAPGPGMAILGSGSVVAQLAQEGLIDEFQIVVHPVVLGDGRTMFAGIKDRLALKHTRTRTFGNGCAFLCYQPLEAPA